MDLQTTLIWKEVKSPYWTVAVLFSLLMILSGMIIIMAENILPTIVGGIVVIYGILDIIDRIIFIKKFDNYIKH